MGNSFSIAGDHDPRDLGLIENVFFFFFCNKPTAKAAANRNYSKKPLKEKKGRWIFSTIDGIREGRRKRRKKGGNAARRDFGRSPFSHVEAAEVFTSGHIPSMPKRIIKDERNYTSDYII
jgi:hypothetical protein